MLVLLLLRKIVYLNTLSHRNGHLWDGHCPSEKFDPFMQSQWKKCGRILPRWHSGGPKYPSQIFLLSRLNLLKKIIPVRFNLTRLSRSIVPVENIAVTIVPVDFSSCELVPVDFSVQKVSQSISLDKFCPSQIILHKISSQSILT